MNVCACSPGSVEEVGAALFAVLCAVECPKRFKDVKECVWQLIQEVFGSKYGVVTTELSAAFRRAVKLFVKECLTSDGEARGVACQVSLLTAASATA